MPRRREVPKRDILPDPKFGNVEVSKFVNTIMKSGKKSVAERIVYGAFDQIVTKTGKDPLEVFGHGSGQHQADGRSQESSRRWRQLPGAG
jgi:small subunit ribosomal protein S7